MMQPTHISTTGPEQHNTNNAFGLIVFIQEHSKKKLFK
jgi:hypothetical protein